MTCRILLTARSFRKTPGPHLAMLREAGCELVDSPQDRPLTAAELAPLLAEVDAAILGVDEVTAEALAQAAGVKVLSRYGVGVDGVDLAAATAKGIVVTNTPGANSVAVAELSFALLMALARHIPRLDREVKSGGWKRLPGSELLGLTLGLVGLGRIGQAMAVRAQAFGMALRYFDPVACPPAFAAQYGIERRELADLYAECDALSLHLPLNAHTANLIDAAALAQMKPGALLINTARGGIVDEAALYEALHRGHLGGAAFDAFAEEPPGESPLLALDNFIATPHAGSATRQTTLRMGRMASENALAVLRGERPEHVVNPEVYG